MKRSLNSFHQKAGVSQDSFFFFFFFLPVDPCVLAGPPLSPSFHPQSFMSDCRSLQGGRTQFSRCCDLISDLGSDLFDRSWGQELAQSPDLGG
jgi:hypothetical protein